MSAKRKISFIGAGNLAWQLAKSLDTAGHQIHQIISRSVESSRPLAEQFGAYFSDNIDMLYTEIDLLVIAVSDDQIEEVVKQVGHVHFSVVHTSGSVPMMVLDGLGNDVGVFYPLQTFSKNVPVDFQKIPILLESNNQNTYKLLWDLAKDISNTVQELHSDQRKKLHMTAVMVNNFSNHLFHLSHEFLDQEGLSFQLLMPLISETVLKLKTTAPFDAQTGPAKRGDMATINAHLELLKNHPQLAGLYREISNSIIESHSINE